MVVDKAQKSIAVWRCFFVARRGIEPLFGVRKQVDSKL